MENIENSLNKLSLNEFNMKSYFDKLDKIIYDICSRKSKQVITYDMFDTDKTRKYKLIVLKEKQKQMKIGEILQVCIGNYENFINLKQGHETGLDVISNVKKIIIEIKNRTNTDNASSKKSNLDKLAKFKKANPKYICIYACINDTTEEKTKKGAIKTIIHNGVEIKHMIGYKFLKFIFDENVELIIDFIKNCIDKYMD
jgi:hypothetical protein